MLQKDTIIIIIVVIIIIIIVVVIIIIISIVRFHFGSILIYAMRFGKPARFPHGVESGIVGAAHSEVLATLAWTQMRPVAGVHSYLG